MIQYFSLFLVLELRVEEQQILRPVLTVRAEEQLSTLLAALILPTAKMNMPILEQIIMLRQQEQQRRK